MDTKDVGREISGVAALDDPVRRRLYFHIVGRGSEVSRDEAAKGVGIARSLAAFHLDKLVDDGLLDVSFRRLSGRGGPGSGRPSKLYRRSARQLEISLPPRRYELAAQLLAEAMESADPRQALASAATKLGKALGQGSSAARSAARAKREPAQRTAVTTALRGCGYEPYRDPDGAIRLRNCPFHSLAERHRAMVCGMNHALIRGMLNGLGVEGYVAALEPRPGECCVALRRSGGSGGALRRPRRQRER